MLEIRDVRLVHAPHRAVGNYGGEIDNWAWPRSHTGDFAFFRAYVGKDGQPADPSPDNVPFQPPAHLELAPGGVAAGDLVFVAGYPGRTNRLQSAVELRRMTKWTYPRYVEKSNQKMAVLATLQQAPGETAIKAGVMRQSVQNGLEKIGGILDTLRSSDLLQRKEADEQAFRAWAGADAARQRYLDALDRQTTSPCSGTGGHSRSLGDGRPPALGPRSPSVVARRGWRRGPRASSAGRSGRPWRR